MKLGTNDRNDFLFVFFEKGLIEYKIQIDSFSDNKIKSRVIKNLIGVTKKGIKHITFLESYKHCDEV